MTQRKTRPAPRRESRVLTDPHAIRALAHPARLAVLDALNDGGEVTATACAEVAGTSPSAMSYHLRALEKWGFVERAEGSGDGRERPWRAVSGGWRVEAMPDSATARATSAVTRVNLERVASELDGWFEHERRQPPQWRDAAIIENQQRWLTPAEAQELRALYDTFLDAKADRTATDHPAEARRVRVTRIMVPLQFD